MQDQCWAKWKLHHKSEACVGVGLLQKEERSARLGMGSWQLTVSPVKHQTRTVTEDIDTATKEAIEDEEMISNKYVGIRFMGTQLLYLLDVPSSKERVWMSTSPIMIEYSILLSRQICAPDQLRSFDRPLQRPTRKAHPKQFLAPY